ncbi:MAG: Uroporphyrinogen-III methyltransferase (EC [uncultured Caballeronia sp.]|nr:MAG: Uroporphyrinogen-III methyltransferase (EC [uncultured Caballeronia sp.]
MKAMGKVYLIGAGPGAADLITVHGMRLLEQADVVLHDALVEPAMLSITRRMRRRSRSASAADSARRPNTSSTSKSWMRRRSMASSCV